MRLKQLIKILAILALSIFFTACNESKKETRYKATLPMPEWDGEINKLGKIGLLYDSENNPIIASKVGFIYSEELKDYDKAIQWYKYSNSMKPMPDNSNYMCYAYQMKKEYEEAIKWCENAIELGSDEALFRLGKVNELSKNYDKAITYYKKLVEKTKDKMAINNIGASYFQLKDYENAEKWYKKAIEEGNLESYQNIATFYHEGLNDDIKSSAYAIALINTKYTKNSVLKLLQKEWKIPNEVIRKGYELQLNSDEFPIKFKGELGL
ncbi:MAG: tetratricopeptide repeat protein [Halarcobacter sp.]